MRKSNVPEEVRVAIQKATNVDKSHAAHHDALILLSIAASNLPTDDEKLAFVSLYTSNRYEKSKESLCTLATYKWMELHFGINVKEGVACKGRAWTGKGLNARTLAAAKAYPWFVHVKDLAFKMPALNLAGAAIMVARLEVTGVAAPTRDELFADFMMELVKARKTAGLVEWTAKYKAKVESGEIKEEPPKEEAPKEEAPKEEAPKEEPTTAMGDALTAASA